MDINAEISDMKVALASLEAKAKALEKLKQWEPRGGDYKSNHCTMRDTVAAVTKARCAMNTYSRLLAYVNEFGEDWEADWACIKPSSSYRQSKYFISFDLELEEYYIKSIGSYRVLSDVYMSRECAEGLAVKLNSGEVVL